MRPVRYVYEDRFSELEPLLAHVEKPSRYIDHEWGTKAKAAAAYRLAARALYPPWRPLAKGGSSYNGKILSAEGERHHRRT